jgi:hypothetical protein
MGPIASLVRRHILVELRGEEWYWQLLGCRGRHADAVERDALSALEWATVRRAVGSLGLEGDERRRWCVRRLHQRALR